MNNPWAGLLKGLMLSASFLNTQTRVHSNTPFQAVGCKACDKCSAFGEAMLKN